MSKESFKSFVRVHPELAHLVSNKKASWQTLYETFDLYGEDASVWDSYLREGAKEEKGLTSNFSEITNLIKNVDLDTFQKGIQGLLKATDLLRNLSSSGKEENKTYEERPIYKYYED